MTAPPPSPEDVAQMRERHVVTVTEYSGYDLDWCVRCDKSWPCDAARLLALVDSLIEERDTWQRRRGQTEKRWRRAEARLHAVLDECARYDQGEGDIEPEDGWRLLRDVRHAATGEGS